jgi:hypothetical protein
MRLYDKATVIRSKNAGPFTLTIDMIFSNEADYQQVLEASSFCAEQIAARYHADPASVAIHPFQKVRAIKISLPRPVSSGAPGDCDVYGSQQHFPLGDMPI